MFTPKYNCTTTQTGILLRDERHINKFDLVSLDDYETKSVSGISQLTLCIKKLSLKQRVGHKIGRPE